MPSTAEEVMTLAISAVSYCLGFFKYGLVSFKDFFLMTYYTRFGRLCEAESL